MCVCVLVNVLKGAILFKFSTFMSVYFYGGQLVDIVIQKNSIHFKMAADIERSKSDFRYQVGPTMFHNGSFVL